MALLKKKSGTSPAPQEQRTQSRNREGLLLQLQEKDPAVRRWAALDLVDYPDTATELCAHLETETVQPVQEACLTALIRFKTPACVKGLLPLLRSENAALRNAVIEALQEMDELTAPYMAGLLKDPQSDVRIFAINVLEALRTPGMLAWLHELIQQDPHINVCATALNLLTEVGTEDMIPAIRALPARFENDPFLVFTAENAIKMISGVHAP